MSSDLSEGGELAVGDLAQYDDSLDREAAEAANGGAELGPLQPLVDELKRNYCREVLAASSSMTAAAKVAGFTPRGFQLMLRKLGMKAEDHLGSR